jgi:L-asparaginase II
VVDASGALLASGGTIDEMVFPRSAIKAFQCLPLLEDGAIETLGFVAEEIALACSSHSGEARHVRVAESMLAKSGHSAENLACGAHWPIAEDAMHDMVRLGQVPSALHNNCSGKHAGMLALAHLLRAPSEGYVDPDHPVQRRIAKTISRLCDCDLSKQACGIDGCSVPTWAIPLRNLATGFARFCTSESTPAQQIIQAVRAHPYLVAGRDRFDTRLMREVPRAFVKTGAEGVYGACVPHAGIGIALKIDDGASRASQLAIAAVLAQLDVWTESEREQLKKHSNGVLLNRRGLEIGRRQASLSAGQD